MTDATPDDEVHRLVASLHLTAWATPAPVPPGDDEGDGA